jgi:hypothetical protein
VTVGLLPSFILRWKVQPDSETDRQCKASAVSKQNTLENVGGEWIKVAANNRLKTIYTYRSKYKSIKNRHLFQACTLDAMK